MTRSNAAHEPSMDEILASIRRIIESGDERPEPTVASRARPERAPHVERLESGAESAANVVARLTPEPLSTETRELPAIEASPSEDAPIAEQADAPMPGMGEVSSAHFEIDLSIFGSGEEEEELAARLRDELSAEDMIDWSELTAALTDETEEEPEPPVAASRIVADAASTEANEETPVSTATIPTEPAPAELVTPAQRRQTGITDETVAAAAASEEPGAGSKASPAAFKASREGNEEPGLDAPFVAANSDSRRMQEFRAAVLDDLNGERRIETASLTSGRTGELVGAAFDDLAEAIREGQMRSMEEMAQDLLRPMLQDWLDENLPKLVERLVREEIERVARGGRR